MLWEAWSLASKWGVRPSTIYDVADPFAAYCFDRAVTLFGSTVEGDMELAAEDAKTTAESLVKRQRVLDRYLGVDPTKVKGRFRDPAAGRSGGGKIEKL